MTSNNNKDNQTTKTIFKTQNEFISKFKERETYVKDILYRTGINRVINDFYNEIDRAHTLPDTVNVKTFISFNNLLTDADTPIAKTLCTEVATMLKKAGFKYKADTSKSGVYNSHRIECTFVKRRTHWIFND